MGLLGDIVEEVFGTKRSGSGSGDAEESGNEITLTNDMISQISNHTIDGLKGDDKYSAEQKVDMVQSALRGARNGTTTNSGKLEKALKKLKTPGGNRLLSDSMINQIIARFLN